MVVVWAPCSEAHLVWLCLMRWVILSHRWSRRYFQLKYNGKISYQLLNVARNSILKLILAVAVQNLNISLIHSDCARNASEVQVLISNRGFRTGWRILSATQAWKYKDRPYEGGCQELSSGIRHTHRELGNTWWWTSHCSPSRSNSLPIFDKPVHACPWDRYSRLQWSTQ